MLLAAVLLLAAAVTSWCSSRSARASRVVTILLPPGPPISALAIELEPAARVYSARLDADGRLRLETDADELKVELPEHCSMHLTAATHSGGLALRAVPRLSLGDDLTQVGYDEPLAIAAKTGCSQAGRITWRQLEGPPLAALQTTDQGRNLTARSLPLAAFLTLPLPRGVVALSPRTQGRYVLEATLHEDGLPDVRRAIRITSLARATGMSSLAVSQRVLLGGEGWRVERAPKNSRASVEHRHGVDSFAPDLAGKFGLIDARGARLELQALTHDRTPMDCGRAECHASLSSAALDTPMSHALQTRAMSAVAFSDRGCALDCHAVGERGLRDGGFLDLARELGFRALAETRYETLPHALQRLAGVRCTSCHGPSAIPIPQDRSKILRASVCATCHDAPPRYVHVQAWSSSRMARSDATPDARHVPACARCHTTGGFLAALGVRKRDDGSRDADDAVVGISCAACHAAHGPHLASGLVREVPQPASLASTSPASASSLCASCHAPTDDELTPSASSAAIWSGTVRLPEALGGGLLRGAAPHADMVGGCTGCHGGASTPSAKLDHSFKVNEPTCRVCHANDGKRRDSAGDGQSMLRERARALRDRIRQSCAALPAADDAHTMHEQQLGSGCGVSDPRARAFYAVALVLEDGGAFVHNAPFAQSLLQDAEALLRR